MWTDVLFSSLIVLAVVWLTLVLWMFRRLRTQHAETFEAIGSPSLFWNNSLKNNWLFLKFLFQGQWQQLGDRLLAIGARVMQVLLITYLTLFAVLFFSNFFVAGMHATAK